jgi:hypothetical protein
MQTPQLIFQISYLCVQLYVRVHFKVHEWDANTEGGA